MKTKRLVGRKARSTWRHAEKLASVRKRAEMRNRQAGTHPSEYLFIIDDDVGPSAFNLAHFCTMIKDIRAHILKIGLDFFLQNGKSRLQYLYTLTEN